MCPTHFYGARAKKNQKADFAMKQTNICRLSGDINNLQTHVKSTMYHQRLPAPPILPIDRLSARITNLYMYVGLCISS